jgi:hypothetical protein
MGGKMSDLPEEKLTEWRGYLRNIESDPQWMAARQERIHARKAAQRDVWRRGAGMATGKKAIERMRHNKSTTSSWALPSQTFANGAVACAFGSPGLRALGD